MEQKEMIVFPSYYKYEKVFSVVFPKAPVKIHISHSGDIILHVPESSGTEFVQLLDEIVEGVWGRPSKHNKHQFVFMGKSKGFDHRLTDLEDGMVRFELFQKKAQCWMADSIGPEENLPLPF